MTSSGHNGTERTISKQKIKVQGRGQMCGKNPNNPSLNKHEMCQDIFVKYQCDIVGVCNFFRHIFRNLDTSRIIVMRLYKKKTK